MVDRFIDHSTSPLSASNSFVMDSLFGREEWIIYSLPFTLDLTMGLVWVSKIAVNTFSFNDQNTVAGKADMLLPSCGILFCIPAIVTRRTHHINMLVQGRWGAQEAESPRLTQEEKHWRQIQMHKLVSKRRLDIHWDFLIAMHHCYRNSSLIKMCKWKSL